MNVDDESLKRLQDYFLGRTVRLNSKTYGTVKVLDVLSLGLFVEPFDKSEEAYYYPPSCENRISIYGPTLVPWSQISGLSFADISIEDAERVRQKAFNYAKEINIRLAAEKYSADLKKES